MNDLVLITKESVKQLIERSDILDTSCKSIINISSRYDPTTGPVFKTIDEHKLQSIAKDMVEINRSVNAFGRTNSRYNCILMSTTMLNDTSPYRILRQCHAQIEAKRGAIKENYFRILKDKVKIRRLSHEIFDTPTMFDEYELELKRIEIMETMTGLSDAMLYLEGAFKEIQNYQEAYNEIRKNNNIPEDWDEQDFEEAEIFHNIRQAFILVYRDLLTTGKCNPGTLEYLSQNGVDAITAYDIVNRYINNTHDLIEMNTTKDAKGNIVNINYPAWEDYQSFLDVVADKFKESYKGPMKRLGLETLLNVDYVFKG